ncbi:hypothetical protein [Chryseobacterium lactis]|nr:hypothetical protein [Chryseobacterium lactis]
MIYTTTTTTTTTTTMWVYHLIGTGFSPSFFITTPLALAKT